MSAQNKQLEWIELTDFKPGLTTIGGDILEPATGAAIMEDCMPNPLGGIIAGMRANSFSINGIANPTTAAIKTIFVRGDDSGTPGNQADRYCFVHDGTNLKVYRWFEPDLVTTWSVIATIAVGTVVNNIVCDTFVDGSNDEYIVFNLFQTSNDGVYTIDPATGTVVNRLAIGITCVVVQDDTIIVANGGTLRWAAALSVSSWPSENNHPIQVSRLGSDIVTMNALAPSDLLLGMNSAPWVLFQGDITQPLTRGMSDARPPEQIQRTPLTKEGVAFVEPNSGVYITSDGNQFNNISAQLTAATWAATSAPLGYSDSMLLAASGGFIYDERTQAWHTTSAFSGPISFAIGNRGAHEIFTASLVDGVGIQIWTFDATLADLAGSYIWKSVPLRSNTGRQIAVREVQLYVETFDSNSVLTVEVGGVAHSITVASASKEQLSFRFLARDEYLDVKVTASAGTPASNQAPSIEVVRIGHTTGHLLTP